MMTNLKSGSGMEEFLRGTMNKEIALGRISGPRVTSPLLNLRIYPLGILPQKAQGEFRLIH